jgi:hypothetical protein
MLRCAVRIMGLDRSDKVLWTKGRMSVKTEVEAAILSIHENPNEGTARVNLRWEGRHQLSDFDLDKLARC